MIHHKLFVTGVALAAMEGILHALQHGLLGIGAVLGAGAAIYVWLLRPVYHFARQTAKVHGVLLGDDEHEPLDHRLTRIEGDVTDMNTRLGSVESSLEAIAAQDRKDIMDVLAAAKHGDGERAA